MISQRRPSGYLLAGDRPISRQLTNSYLRLLSTAGSHHARAARCRAGRATGAAAPGWRRDPVPRSSAARPRTPSRVHLAGLLGYGRLYELDRSISPRPVTLDGGLQRSVTTKLREIFEPEVAEGRRTDGQAPARRLRPGKVIYSFTLYEANAATPTSSACRPTTSTSLSTSTRAPSSTSARPPSCGCW
jgi:hypothetical protein